MWASVTFEKEIEKTPENCTVCKFVDICDSAMHGITKSGNRWTVAAQRGRVKGCPLKIEE